MSKRAVVLFNLGGPDGPDAVRPFLFNLFSDPAIIGLPQPLRWLVAKMISARRAPVARAIYGHIGGKSPLLDLTRAQAEALERELGGETRVFIAMRYWHPLSDETARAVKAYQPDEVVLLPLYPQYSTTTTGSSVADWHRAARAAGVDAPTRTVCCYPQGTGWIGAQAALVGDAIKDLDGPYRVLFSAHGLPKKVVDGGDPYQWQVERTAAAVVERLGIDKLDWSVCYQSRVGPLEWIGPSTEEELARAGVDGTAAVVVPIAFVSEHSETLVELDIEYKELAEKKGVPVYVRVPAVGTHPDFIAALAALVEGAGNGVCSNTGERLCPAMFGRCAMTGA
jgi:ferrochelatase